MPRHLPPVFQFRLFAGLCLAFIIATAVGTVSHEMGHVAVAKHFGYETSLSYASMSYEIPEIAELQEYYEAYEEYIESEEDSPEKDAYIEYREQLGHKLRKTAFYITLGGPLQTMATGTAGALILLFCRKKITRRSFIGFWGWVAVMLSFFWSRQVFNFLMSSDEWLAPAKKYYRSDEPKISLYLGLPHWAFGLATAATGSLLLLWVVFRVIPPRQRLTFVLSGIVGSALGWYIWMHWLGPIALP